MTKNLILSAAVGYNFPQIEFFLKSLRKFYNDEISLIISQDNLELEKKLKEYNCKIIKSKINKKKIQFERYKIYLEFLKTKNTKIFFCVTAGIFIFRIIHLILILVNRSIFF